MIDAALVAALFILVWVAVLIPPAARGSVSRRQAFEHSLREQFHGDGQAHATTVPEPPSPAARRRQVLGGLLVAIGSSLLLGLLPTFRIMLVVHLLLVDSFLAVVAVVVHERDSQARLGTAGRVSPRRPAVRAHRRRSAQPALTGTSFAAPDPAEVGLSA